MTDAWNCGYKEGIFCTYHGGYCNDYPYCNGIELGEEEE